MVLVFILVLIVIIAAIWYITDIMDANRKAPPPAQSQSQSQSPSPSPSPVANEPFSKMFRL